MNFTANGITQSSPEIKHLQNCILCFLTGPKVAQRKAEEKLCGYFAALRLCVRFFFGSGLSGLCDKNEESAERCRLAQAFFRGNAARTSLGFL